MAKGSKPEKGYDKFAFAVPSGPQPTIEERTVIVGEDDMPPVGTEEPQTVEETTKLSNLTNEELANRVAAMKTQQDEVERMREENHARLTQTFTGTLLRGRETPPMVAKEDTPEIIRDFHMLLQELLIGGAIQPYNTFMLHKVNMMIQKIEADYAKQE